MISVSAGEPRVIPRNGSPAEQSAIDSSSKSEVSEFISSMRAGDNAVGLNVLKDDVAVKDIMVMRFQMLAGYSLMHLWRMKIVMKN